MHLDPENRTIPELYRPAGSKTSLGIWKTRYGLPVYSVYLALSVVNLTDNPALISGAGKSVLSSFVITELRKYPDTEHQVLHFFCKERDPGASTAAAIASNLIDQLIESNRLYPLFKILNGAHEKYAKSDKCTDFETLWNIFAAMVKAFPTRVVAVIDALDECLTDRGLLLERITSDVDMDGKISFFLTSRDEQDIRDKLGEQSDIALCAMSVDEDIKDFVVQRLPKLLCFQQWLARSGKHDWEARIVQEVPKLSAGMFRYAALLLDQLDSPLVDVAKLLDSPPIGLDRMYERILLRLELAEEHLPLYIQRRETRKKLLSWVAMAKQPLRVIDLAYVCAVGDDCDDEFDPAERLLFTADNITDMCGPLIEIADGTAQFTHLSVKEFLIQKPSDGWPWDPRMQYYWVDETQANAAMAITCSK